MQEQAKALLKKGFSIIPIDTKTKKPLIIWEGLQSTKAVETEVEGWFKQWPEAGVGIITGRLSNLLVFDIDPRHEGKKELFEKYKTVTCRTGGGGWHYYFRFPKGEKIRNTVNIFKGIDVRGEGGYVIAPPSKHPSGGKYYWLKGADKIADLPKELEEKLREKKTYSGSTFDPEIVHGVGEGERNQAAASLIGKTIQGLRQGDFQTIAWPLIKSWNKQYNRPPLPILELRRTFLSICEIELKRRKGEIDKTTIKNTFETSEELLKNPPKEEPMIIKSLVPQGCTFISGLPKHYKSYISLHLADCLTNGKLLFNKFEVKQKKTLILDRENPRGLVYKRLKQLEIKENKNLIFSFDYTPINKKGFQEGLLASLEDDKIEFLVIDSFRRFFQGNENDSSEVSKFFAFIDQMKSLGIAVLILHHHRKTINGGRTDLQQIMRGSSDLSAYPDAHIAIRKNMIDGMLGIKIEPVYLRVDIPQQPFLVEIKHPNDNQDKINFDFKLFVTTEEEKPQAAKIDILTILQETPNKWFNRNEFHELLKSKGYGKTVLDKTAERLAEDKQINKKIGERNKISYRNFRIENKLF